MPDEPGSAPRCVVCGSHRDANVHLKQYAYANYHEYREPGSTSLKYLVTDTYGQMSSGPGYVFDCNSGLSYIPKKLSMSGDAHWKAHDSLPADKYVSVLLEHKIYGCTLHIVQDCDLDIVAPIR